MDMGNSLNLAHHDKLSFWSAFNYLIDVGSSFNLKHLEQSNVSSHNYDILGAKMLWKPKEARILTNFIDQPL